MVTFVSICIVFRNMSQLVTVIYCTKKRKTRCQIGCKFSTSTTNKHLFFVVYLWLEQQMVHVNTKSSPVLAKTYLSMACGDVGGQSVL